MPATDQQKIRPTKEPTPAAKKNYLPLWICLTLALGTLVLFWPVRHFQFIRYDDQDYVTENRVVQSGLTHDGVVWAFTHVHSSNWHPLTWMSHMLDCQLFGLDAGKHHFTALLLHTLTTVLLFLAMKKLTGAMWRSALVAAVFAIHPLHVESVAWVSERKDVLCALFWVLTMGAYARYAESRSPKENIQRSTFNAQRPKLWYLLALFFFALGLLSKPMIVTLPCVLLLLDFWPLRRVTSDGWRVAGKNAGHLVLEKIPFFVLSGISCTVTFLAQKNAGAMRSLDAIPIILRVENALVSYAVYLLRTFWPNDLAIFYPHPEMIPLWQWLGALLLVVAISALVIRQLKERSYLAVGWFWYLGTLVPVLGLVQVGVQARADRFAYIPMIGISIALIWGACDLLKNFAQRRAVWIFLSAAMLIACAMVSARQIQFWQNSKSLFGHALKVTSENFVAHHTYGTALAEEEKNDEAEKHFREALRIHPRFPEAEQNLGNILLGKNQFEEALIHYKKALEYRPNFERAYDSLGLLYAKQEKWPESIENFEKAIALDPLNGGTHFNLGSALLKSGKADDAIAHYQKALQLDANLPEAHYQLALVFGSRGKTEEVLAHLQEVVRLKPDWIDPLGRLGWIWATDPNPKFRNGAGAVQVSERAAILTQRKDARILSVLAAAYAEAGRFPEAIQTAEEAEKLALAQGQAEQVKSIEKKLTFYRTGKPYHQE